MTSPSADSCSIALLGDLILGEPEPDFFFERARAVLSTKDLVVGHLEVPHTHHGRELAFDVPAEPHAPDRLSALARAGVHVATLAGNHIYDFGREGIVDTLSALADAGVVTCGAGVDLQRASAPARVERRQRRIGILSYNCVGPREAFASDNRAGCAYVRIVSTVTGEEVGPQTKELQATIPALDSLDDLSRAIERLGREVDVVVVALHKGIVHTPAMLAGYERPLARADGQIDAGYLPCWILPSGQPEPCGRDARGQAVFDYVADISRRAGFATELAWQGDRVLVR